jgi:ABC-type transport system involved in cytochrome c biogenesis permease subunit
MIASHAVILFASYLAFFIAVITGIAFLIQEGGLKRKDPNVLNGQAIPLELLDRVNWLAVTIGFFLFSFGVIQGHLLARWEWGTYFSGDPKELSSLVTWLAYALVLVLRWRMGLKGRRVVFLSVMAFAFVLFTFVGVNWILGSRHTFWWRPPVG